MIEKYLKKLQELQCKTLGTPVRFWLHTHFDDDANEPFLCVTVMGPEWCNKSDDSQYLSTHLYQWNESSEEENEASQAKVYASIEAFVNNLLSK